MLHGSLAPGLRAMHRIRVPGSTRRSPAAPAAPGAGDSAGPIPTSCPAPLLTMAIPVCRQHGARREDSAHPLCRRCWEMIPPHPDTQWGHFGISSLPLVTPEQLWTPHPDLRDPRAPPPHHMPPCQLGGAARQELPAPHNPQAGASSVSPHETPQ